jgi:hypothetical protein
MKKYPLPLLILGLFLIFSCHKTNSGNNTTTSISTYLSSVVSYSPQSRTVDSFSYDSLNRLGQFSQYIYDTTSGSPLYQTFTAHFTYQGNATIPTTYKYADTPAGNYGDLHLLSFDGQNRIAKDTSLSGSGFVTYYSYPNNNSAATVLFEGTLQDNQIDTLFLSNGNVSEERIYTSDIPGQPDDLDGDVHFGYASTANPTYHPAITNSIGPLLTILEIDGFGGNVDFLSKNVVDKLTGPAQGLPTGVSINYTLTNDSKGRLSQMSASFGGTTGTIVFNYY